MNLPKVTKVMSMAPISKVGCVSMAPLQQGGEKGEEVLLLDGGSEDGHVSPPD